MMLAIISLPSLCIVVFVFRVAIMCSDDTCGSNLPTLILQQFIHTVHRIAIYARNTRHTTQAVCTWSRWFLN
jgi:hypothetical protein